MSPPTSIAHYRIVSKLGEGGMGAVYRATDTKLNRDVAIKVLPQAFAQDASRMARFEREAQVLASLNHPNIAQIYGIEQGAIVMELVEGEEIAGRQPIGTAMEYARQIAAGLEAAHEKGIVHRDLKPANIKATAEGVVKLLDFGLAKSPMQPDDGGTLTISMTQAGMIVGTAAYMSPEQARGKPVDKRADIWAFGVVLFEMLSGKQLFAGGETLTDVLAAVVTREPDWKSLPRETPPHLRLLLERCLQKDAKLRLRDIGEARIALEQPVVEVSVPATAPVMPRRTILPWTVAAVMAATAAGAGFVAWRGSRPIERPLSRLKAELGTGAGQGVQPAAILSPDGRRLAYTVRGSAEGVPQLATRLLSDAASTNLAGTDGAMQPFYSPDSRWIGFFADGQLKKISVHGGAAVTLCTAAAIPAGAWWGRDGWIVASLDGQHLSRVPESGGKPERIEPRDSQAKGDRIWRWPQVVNGMVLFTANSGRLADGEIRILSLKDGGVTTVAQGGSFGRYLPSGHIAYVHEGKLFAVPFDLDRLETRGTAVPVLDDISAASTAGGPLSIADDGTVVYLAGKPGNANRQLASVDLAGKDAGKDAGKSTPLWTTVGAVLSPKISPDGKLVVGSVEGAMTVYDPGRAAVSRLSTARGRSVVWTPDGRHLVFSGTATGPEERELAVWWARADGSGQPERLFSKQTSTLRVTSVSPDGRHVAFWTVRSEESNRPEIWMLTLDTSDPDHPKAGAPELFLSRPGGTSDAAFSPDGRWIAYTGSTSGSHLPDVFVRPYPGTAESPQWQISNAGGGFAVWPRKGNALFYRSLTGEIMAVDYRVSGGAFVAGKPRKTGVFAASLTVGMSYDVSPDGTRILITRPEAPVEEGPVHVTFLLNFFDELKRRLP